MTTITRFAPSPTGFIHIGNTRTALFNWLYAKRHGGQFILRYDDTDTVRSKQHFADQIAKDLEWLGINPDRIERQSSRFSAYNQAFENLKEAGLLYPCYETPDELDRRRKILLSRRLPPVYGREALKLSDEDRAELEAQGRKPHWRFLLPNYDTSPFEPRRTEVTWDDLVRGPQVIDLASMSDPILIREDGAYLYTLPSVVDDIEMGVTHIIRGDDHVTNTGAQIAIFKALGATPPSFGHHNLLTTTSGDGLSKRTGALSIKSLAQEGYEPMAVASLAVLIGTSQSVHAVDNLSTLAQDFDPSISTKSAAKFDPSELDVLNCQYVHSLEFEQVKDRLAALGIDTPIASDFWNGVRGNLTRVQDASLWWSVITNGPGEGVALASEDIDFVREAFALLPSGEFDHGTWKQWTQAVKQATGRKGKALFMPLRIALTGFSSGPEIADLLPLLGRERTLARQP